MICALSAKCMNATILSTANVSAAARIAEAAAHNSAMKQRSRGSAEYGLASGISGAFIDRQSRNLMNP